MFKEMFEKIIHDPQNNVIINGDLDQDTNKFNMEYELNLRSIYW